jgi:hypothetical protein
MKELYEFHKQWKYEKHEFSRFNIMLLNAEPARVRALGTVYWEAGSDDMVKPIKNVRPPSQFVTHRVSAKSRIDSRKNLTLGFDPVVG